MGSVISLLLMSIIVSYSTCVPQFQSKFSNIYCVHACFYSFILHSVNPYKVLKNLNDIEFVILLIIYIQNKYITGYILR